MTRRRGEVSVARLGLELRAIPAAVAFLTRIPVGRWVAFDGDDVTRAGPVFPLVGAAIGGVVGATALGLSGPLSPFVAVALALAVETVLTGALHVDALADTADALGARSREQALAIMRDHAIGSYGAVAIGLDLLIKAGALTMLAGEGHVVGFMVAAGALSRMTPVVLAAALPYARRGEGAGASLTRGGCLRAALAAATALLIAFAATGDDGMIVAALAAMTVLFLGLGFRHWLAGVTGDALGAAVEVSELAVLVAAAALVGAG